ncbi:MAG: hypothetical protein DRQ78_00375 [Epsilonproteobacteria bacterium]|nr:MAG: hypothetical protein DRQ78_00375 [Campylobacterota bacterium]
MQVKQLKQLLQTYDFIDFALLFGSYANNTQKVLSDIDIGIYTNRSIGLVEQGFLISSIEEKFEKNIDLVILNNLSKSNAKLAFNIVNNHKIIFCNNTEIYIDFKIYTYKFYFDQKPMYEMFDKALLERIANGTYGKAQAS